MWKIIVLAVCSAAAALRVSSSPLIEGLVAPTFTPLDANGQFDASQVGKMAAWVNKTGLQWVYLTGSTGESVDLTPSERKVHTSSVSASPLTRASDPLHPLRRRWSSSG